MPIIRTLIRSGTLAVSLTLSFDAPALAQTQPTITVDGKAVAGRVSPLLFGANHRWVSDASGSADPRTGYTYPKVIAQIKDVGISMIRYPAGLLGNLFQWDRAIGPQAKRGQQISGLVLTPVPFDSKFGVDEYGDLLEKTGATGNLLINFGTASAADAANFVAYMTAPRGSPPVNGIDWAARRAANGHPAPYKVAYAEIGNEYEPSIQKMIDQNYWILGEPVSINPACASDKISCLYAFGGSTRFVQQAAVAIADWREPTSISSGAPRQTVYARYKPVAAGSETVFVNGEAWKGRSDLTAANADEQVYVVDYVTGAITFGDGRRGAIPPKGAKITVSYTSGPHDGFVDFYRAIKAANPNVKVCTSIHDESFLRIMGSQHAYDCIQQHNAYYISDPKRDILSGGLNDFFVFTAARMNDFGKKIHHTQDLVSKHAGPNSGKVELLLSEYGQLGTFPDYSRHFARSHGQAVMTALAVREFVLKQVAAADRTVLTDFTFGAMPPELAAVQSSDAAAAEEALKHPENSTSGDFALFAGPGPNTVVTPPGLALKLMRQNMGKMLVTSAVTANPKLSSSKGDTVDALQTFATRDDKGNVYLVVINVDPQRDLTAAVAVSNLTHGPTATVSTLASPNINDENNPRNPTLVGIKQRTVRLESGKLEFSFPKHSVAAIRLPSK